MSAFSKHRLLIPIAGSNAMVHNSATPPVPVNANGVSLNGYWRSRPASECGLLSEPCTETNLAVNRTDATGGVYRWELAVRFNGTGVELPIQLGTAEYLSRALFTFRIDDKFPKYLYLGACSPDAPPPENVCQVFGIDADTTIRAPEEDMQAAAVHHNVTFSDLPNTSHTIFIQGEQGAFLSAPYAVVELDPSSTIEVGESKRLAVGWSDTFVRYEGSGWEEAETEEFPLELAFGAESTPTVKETNAMGDSVSFTFFGTEVVALTQYGESLDGSGLLLSIRLDDSPPEDFDVGQLNAEAGTSTRWSFKGSTLDATQLHTVNITVKDITADAVEAGTKLSLRGFSYTPSFSTLEDAEKLLEEWDRKDAISTPTPEMSPGPSPTPSPSPDPSPSSNGDLAGAIAAGVVAFVVFAAAGVFIWLWIRRRRRAESERLNRSSTIIQSYSDNPPPMPITPYMTSYQTTALELNGMSGVSTPNTTGSATQLLRSQPVTSSDNGANVQDNNRPAAVAQDSSSSELIGRVQDLLERVNAMEHPPVYQHAPQSKDIS